MRAEQLEVGKVYTSEKHLPKGKAMLLDMDLEMKGKHKFVSLLFDYGYNVRGGYDPVSHFTRGDIDFKEFELNDEEYRYHPSTSSHFRGCDCPLCKGDLQP